MGAFGPQKKEFDSSSSSSSSSSSRNFGRDFLSMFWSKNPDQIFRIFISPIRLFFYIAFFNLSVLPQNAPTVKLPLIPKISPPALFRTFL